jgi:steroid delta-isomerase-like uncharacterized protein
MRQTGILLIIATILILSGCASSENDTKAGNIELVQVVFSEVWSKGNVDLIDELYATDFVGHFPAETFHGLEGIRTHVITHRTAFPDWTEEIEDLMADQDRVVARFRSRGTNLGEFLGNPPTRNTVEISEVAIFRFKDGKIVEQWVYPDILDMQRQLKGERQQ